MTKKSKSRVKPHSKLTKQRQPDSSDDEEWPCLARLALLGVWRDLCVEQAAREVCSLLRVQEVGARSMHGGGERIYVSQLRL